MPTPRTKTKPDPNVKCTRCGTMRRNARGKCQLSLFADISRLGNHTYPRPEKPRGFAL